MKSRIICFLLLCSCLLKAKEFSGFVGTSEGEPLENVFVQIDSLFDVTDKKGYFHLNSVSDEDSIFIHKIGFEDKKLKILDVHDKIILKRQPVELNGITVFEKKESTRSKFDNQVIYTDAHNGNDLYEIIMKHTGMIVANSSSGNNDKRLILPGFKASHVQVLLDNVPLNEQGQSVNLASIPLELIEKIEITNGNRADLTANGTAAVINLFTKKDKRVPFNLKYTFGSFGLNRYSITGGINLDRIHLDLLLAKEISDNDFKYKSEKFWDNPDSMRVRKGNDISIKEAFLNLSWHRSGLRLEGKQLINRFDSGLPGPANNPELYKNSRLKGINSKTFINCNWSRSNSKILTCLYYFYKESQYDNTKIDEPWSNFDYYYVKNCHQVKKIGLKQDLLLEVDAFRVKTGYDFIRETFKYDEKTNPENSLNPVDQTEVSVFGKFDIERAYERVGYRFNLVGRLLRSDNFGYFPVVSFSPELYWNYITNFQLGIKIGNSLTLPSYYDIYWKTYNQNMGNSELFLGEPDLKPEQSLGTLISVEIGEEDNKISLTYRKDIINDMIILVPYMGSFWKPMNISGAEIKSYQINGNLKVVEPVKIVCNYLHTEALDRTRDTNGDHSSFWGKNIMFTPEYTLNAGIRLLLGDFLLAADFTKIGEQWTTRDQLTSDKKLAAYELFDLKLDHNFNFWGMTIMTMLSLNNLFDERYEITRYMPEPGFNWNISISGQYEIY